MQISNLHQSVQVERVFRLSETISGVEIRHMTKLGWSLVYTHILCLVHVKLFAISIAVLSFLAVRDDKQYNRDEVDVIGSLFRVHRKP